MEKSTSSIPIENNDDSVAGLNDSEANPSVNTQHEEGVPLHTRTSDVFHKRVEAARSHAGSLISLIKGLREDNKMLSNMMNQKEKTIRKLKRQLALKSGDSNLQSSSEGSVTSTEQQDESSGTSDEKYIKQLEVEVCNMKERIVSQKKTEKDLREELQESSQLIYDLNKGLEAVRDIETKMTKKHEDLKTDLEKKDKELQILRTQRNITVTSDDEGIRKELKIAKERSKHLEEVLANTQTAYLQQHNELIEKRKNIDKLHEEEDQLHLRVASLESKNEDLREDIAMKSSEILDTMHIISAMETELISLKEEYEIEYNSKLTANDLTIANLKDKIGKLEKEKSEMQSKVNKMDADKKDLHAELCRTQEEVRNLKEQVVEYNKSELETEKKGSILPTENGQQRSPCEIGLNKNVQQCEATSIKSASCTLLETNDMKKIICDYREAEATYDKLRIKFLSPAAIKSESVTSIHNALKPLRESIKVMEKAKACRQQLLSELEVLKRKKMDILDGYIKRNCS